MVSSDSYPDDPLSRSGSAQRDAAPQRRPWQVPVVEDLPPLRDLTLQSGAAVPGDESIF